MELHPLAQRFAEVAEVYERGRPEYAPAVAGAIAAELRLAAGAPVLDLAAGTGKLTRALHAFGLDVIAVEPQAELREMLASQLPDVHVAEGVAEAIPLPDESVAAVTVAEAFHWFDHAAALAEMRRVLRPRGGLAVLKMLPDWGGTSWAHDVGTLIAEARPEHPQFDGPSWQDSVRAAGEWSEPRELRITFTRPTLPEECVAYIASISWIAALPPEQRLQTLTRVAEIVEAGETPAEMPVHVRVGLTTLRG